MEKFISLHFLFFFTVIINAQDITGNLDGLISDSLSSPLPGVNVTVQSENLQGLKGTATNEKGYFNIFSLPVGIYKVKISMMGFREISIENVQIRLGKTTYLGEIKLEQDVIALPEVTISGKKQNIDPTSTTYGGNLQPKDYEQLPLTRDYKNLITLLPQANTSYYGDEVNVGGSTGFENKYFVDGVEVTNVALGTTGTNLPYNFIREIELKAGGYGAEFRSSLGGLVNVVTYSGSNEFTSSLFGFYTGNSITNNSRLGLLDPAQGNFINYDIGLSLGGPLVLDKLWFFAAYNPNFNIRDVEVPGFGISQDKTVMHSFAAKLTWRTSDELGITLTATGDPRKWDAVGRYIIDPPAQMLNPDSYYQKVHDGSVNISLNGSYKIGQSIIINGLLSEIIRNITIEPATQRGKVEDFFVDVSGPIWAGGTLRDIEAHVYSTMAGIKGNILTGDHTLSAGFEYKIKSVDHNQSDDIITKFDSTYYQVDRKRFAGEVYHHVPSAFIQDSWMITKKLRINGGVRWDGQYIYGTNNEVVQTITAPLQPRVGITFILDDEGLNKFSGFIGRFSQEYALIHSVGYHSNRGYDLRVIYDHDPRIDPSGADTMYNNQHFITPEVEGLRAQYFDEISLGYERSIGLNLKGGIQALYRTLGEAIDNAWLVDEKRYQYGNPGRGILSDWPRPQRDYTAIIISIERNTDKYFNFLISYVLSRSYGNYEGLFDVFFHSLNPNSNAVFNDLSTAWNNTKGLLPNDRTHVFKFSGSYNFLFGLSAGISFFVESGTPLSEIGKTDYGIKFLKPRGSLGRTPTIWDISARFTYALSIISSNRSRLILDLFHIASQLEPVDINQLHYNGIDENGNPVSPNPEYGQAYRYQQPMSIRLGMEINF